MRLDNPPKMKVLKASVRYGSFFTDEERAELERRTEREQPLRRLGGRDAAGGGLK